MGISRKMRSEAGTTLLEVIIAVAVAAIALVSFVTLVISSLNMEDHARKVTEATIIADDKLKEIELLGYPEPGKTEGLVNGEDPSGFSFSLVVTDTPINGVRQLDVEVFWDKKRSSVELISFMAKP